MVKATLGKAYLWIIPDSLATTSILSLAVMQQIESDVLDNSSLDFPRPPYMIITEKLFLSILYRTVTKERCKNIDKLKVENEEKDREIAKKK